MGNVLEFFVKMKDMMSSGLVKIAGTADKSFGKVQSMVDRVTSQMDKLKSKVNDVDRAANNSSFFSGGLFKKLAVGAALLGAVSFVGNVAKGSYDKALENKGLSNAINTTTGGHGKEAMAQTKTIADKYGINYEASLEGVKTLTGGLMSMNIPLKEQMKIFEGVSTGVAAMNLGAEQSKGAMLALGQMASKGTVSAGELRGQLGERIPGAFGIAAKAMNVTESELGKMMQKGELAASDFLPRFAAEMQKTFGADALKNANGPAAVQERFNNALYEAQVTIGQGLLPIITPMLSMFTRMAVDIIPYISSGLNQVVNFLSGINTETGVWAVWIDLVKQYAFIVWDGLSGIFRTVWSIIKSVGQWAANSVLIQDIFWAIGIFAEAIFWAINKVGEAIKWVWENIMKPYYTAIEEVYKWVKGMLGFGKEMKVVGEVNGNVKNTSVSLTDAGKMASPTQIPTGKAGEAMKSQKDDVARGVTGGGPRTINIQIGKQVEKIEIHAGSVNEGLSNLEGRVEEIFLRILNSGASLQ